MHQDRNRYDVLVVGGGPAGLTAAVTLAHYGVRVLVVERHAGTSIFPKATGVSVRSMELFRAWGITGRIQDGAMDVQPLGSVSSTLADPRHMPISLGFPTAEEALAVSPVLPCLAPQDHVEPVLLEHLRASGGEARFRTELVDLAMAADGVTADLHDHAAGRRYRVRARYLVGADGPDSTVRSRLGIGVDHLGKRGDHVAVLFRADLSAVHGDRRYGLYAVGQPEPSQVLVAAGTHRWVYGWQWRPERGETVADVTHGQWIERIRADVGVPDLAPEILGVFPFEMSAAVATSYRAGCGFLVGDAAHRMTPVGGTGMNTAIAAAHNLGWKLGWVINGWAGEALLDSYQPERQPAGTRNALRSLGVSEKGAPEGLAQDLGVGYESAVIVSDGTVAAGGAAGFQPTARPGARAPHAWVEYAGRPVSTLDLFEGRLTLLTGGRAVGWRRAATQLVDTGLPLAVLAAGQDLSDPDAALAELYGIGDAGAVLVRPDGHVAWRAATAAANPSAVLRSAVDTAVGRRSHDHEAVVAS